MDEITIYRVRKSADDLKSQKGAYFIFSNALRVAKRKKCNIYISNGKCVWKYSKNRQKRWKIF